MGAQGRGEEKAMKMSAREEITYNILLMILEGKAPLVSEGGGWLLAQSNPRTPAWLYLTCEPGVATQKAICEALEARLAENPELRVTADPRFARKTLEALAVQTGRALRETMPMIAYACMRVSGVPSSGRIRRPTPADRGALAELIRQMAADAEGQTLSDGEAAGFADAMANSDRLCLWDDGGVRAMALIAHRTERYARLNTVVTDRAQRGKGYCGMLMAALSEELLSQGVTPMLYADARNPASNGAYRRVGFEEAGRATEYALG